MRPEREIAGILPLRDPAEIDHARSLLGQSPQRMGAVSGIMPITDPDEMRMAQSVLKNAQPLGLVPTAPAVEPEDTRSPMAWRMAKQFAHDFAQTLPSALVAGFSLQSRLHKMAGLSTDLPDSLAHGALRIKAKLTETLMEPEPEFWVKLAGGFGSLASFLVPSLGTGAAVKILASRKASEGFARWLSVVTGSAAHSVLESAVEASQEVERQIMEEGLDPAEASAKGDKVFWANLPVLMATNQIYYQPLGTFGRLFAVAQAAGLEGAQEAYQEIVQLWAQGHSLKDIYSQPHLRKHIGEAAAIGAIVGGGARAVLPGGRRGEDPGSEEGDTLGDAAAGLPPAPGDVPRGTALPLQRTPGDLEVPGSGDLVVQNEQDRWDAFVRQVADMDMGTLFGLYQSWQRAPFNPNETEKIFSIGQLLYNELRRRGYTPPAGQDIDPRRSSMEQAYAEAEAVIVNESPQKLLEGGGPVGQAPAEPGLPAAPEKAPGSPVDESGPAVVPEQGPQGDVQAPPQQGVQPLAPEAALAAPEPAPAQEVDYKGHPAKYTGNVRQMFGKPHYEVEVQSGVLKGKKHFIKQAPAAPVAPQAPAAPPTEIEGQKGETIEQRRQKAVSHREVLKDEMQDVPEPRRWTTLTPDGETEVTGEWRVVSAGELTTSEMPGYNQELLQERDRGSRRSLKEQVVKISQSIKPRLLGDSTIGSTGAPITLPDGTVLSGNGRTMAIRKAYEQGTAEEYRAWAVQEAKKRGIEGAEGIQNPVLVRSMRDSGGKTTMDVSLAMNKEATQAKSDSEHASTDARYIIERDLLNLLQTDAQGDLLAASNRPFLDAFLEATGDQSLVDADGGYGDRMSRRVSNALLAVAVGSGPRGRDIVRMLVEKAGVLGMRKQVQGIAAAAPALIRLAAVKPSMDITPYLSEAMESMLSYRKGKVRGEFDSLPAWMNQGALFVKSRSAESDMILAKIGDAKSIKEVREFLEAYAEKAEKATTEDSGAGLFKVEPTKPKDILGRLRDEGKQADEQGKAEGPSGSQGPDLFKPAEGVPGRPTEPEGGDPGKPAEGQAKGLKKAKKKAAKKTLKKKASKVDSSDIYLGALFGGLQSAYNQVKMQISGKGRRLRVRQSDMQEWLDRDHYERDSVTHLFRNPSRYIDVVWNKLGSDLYLFRKAVRTAGGRVPHHLDPARLMQQYKGWSGLAQMFVERGVRGFKDTKKRLSEPLIEIVLDPKYKIPQNWKVFNYYLVAKRLVGLYNNPETMHHYYTEGGKERADAMEELDKARRILAHYGRLFPQWDEAAKRITEYSNALIEYLVEAKILSRAGADAMYAKHPDYVPLEVLDALEQKGATKTLQMARRPVRTMGKVRGGTTYAMPLASLIAKTFSTVRLAHDGDVRMKLADLVAQVGEDPHDGMPMIGWEVDPKKHPIHKRVRELTDAIGLRPRKIRKKLMEEYGDVLGADEIDVIMGEFMGLDNQSLDAMTKLWIQSSFQEKGVISYMREGKLKYLKVNMDIYEALTRTSGAQAENLLRHIGLISKAMRVGATTNPEFIGRNPVRDIMQIIVTSRYMVNWDKGMASGFKDLFMLFPRVVRGVVDASVKGERYERWILSHGGMAHIAARDMLGFEKQWNELIKAGGKKRYVLMKHPLAALQMLAGWTEAGPRLAVFNKTFDELMSTGKYSVRGAELLAGFESRESSLDFQDMGEAIGPLNMLIPFLNAHIRGHTQLVKSFADPARRKNAAINVAIGIFLPSVLLWLKNHDEEWYKDLPRWLKNSAWLFSPDKGKTIVAIPKPFELGLTAGSLPERFLEQVAGEDPKAIETLLMDMTKGVPANILPALLGIVEGVADYSFWRGERLVGRGLQQMPAELQYTSRTSEIAKLVGKDMSISPIHVENWVNTSFAGLGRYALAIADVAINAGRGEIQLKPWEKNWLQSVNKPERRSMLEAIPFIKAFVRSNPRASTIYTDDFYDYLQQAEEATHAYNSMVRAKSSKAEMAWLLEENLFWISAQPYLSQSAQAMSELTARVRVIENPDMDLTPAKRREMLNDHIEARNAIAKAAVRNVRSLQKNPDQWRRMSREAAEMVRQALKEAKGN